MENTTYASRLRYLDADALGDAAVNYDGLDVYGPDGEKIGDIDGFIIDADARRVNYVVIDSGGWFSSQRLLLPIGHAALAEDRQSLRTDVTRDALRRLPEYDEDRFRAFTDEELRAFERDTVVACCPDEPLEEVSATSWGYESRRHYRQPDWWSGSRYQDGRLRGIGRDASAGAGSVRAAEGVPASAGYVGSREERGPGRADASPAARPATARRLDGDASPHLDGRAQPGDVLGIETAGERTEIGDTAEDEDKRRRDAEKARAKEDPPRQSER